MTIITAVVDNNIELVKNILEKDPSKVNTKGALDTPLLYIAIQRNHSEIVKLILSYDKYLKRVLHNGSLLLASQLDLVDMVKVLLEHSKCKVKWYILKKNFSLKCIEIIKVLLDSKVYIHSKDINYQNRSGESFLHIAIRINNIELIRLLVARENINLNLKDSYHNTPLLDVVKKYVWTIKKSEIKFYQETIRLLIQDNRTKLKIKDKDGRTYLELVDKYYKRYKLFYKLNSTATFGKLVKSCIELGKVIKEALIVRRNLLIMGYNLVQLCTSFIKSNCRKFKKRDLLILPRDIKKLFLKKNLLKN